jgi:hypothetical protein
MTRVRFPSPAPILSQNLKPKNEVGVTVRVTSHSNTPYVAAVAVHAFFWRSARSSAPCGTNIEGSNLSFLFSGHVERRLLRTVAAVAVSKSFSIDGAQLDDRLVSRLELTESRKSCSLEAISRAVLYGGRWLSLLAEA